MERKRRRSLSSTVCVSLIDKLSREALGVMKQRLIAKEEKNGLGNVAGCSGMYYREMGDTCKKSVRFDGKRFLAPGGAWNDRDYFVTLSRNQVEVNGFI